MTYPIRPHLYQLSADVTERQAYDRFKTGEIDAGEYSSILRECNTQRRVARMQMAILVPMKRERGGSYQDKKF